MTLEQAKAEVSAWTKGDVRCICGNNDLRSTIHVDPESKEVTELSVFCPKCSETVFRKTISGNTITTSNKFRPIYGMDYGNCKN